MSKKCGIDMAIGGDIPFSYTFEFKIPKWLLNQGGGLLTLIAGWYGATSTNGLKAPSNWHDLSNVIYTFFSSSDFAFTIACFIGLLGFWLSEAKAEKIREYKDYQATIDDLSRKLDSLQLDYDRETKDYKSIAGNWMKTLIADLKCGGTRERASLYKFDGQVFFLLGRWSDNHDFNKPGRSSYRDKEGILGEAFRNNHAFDDNLPDPATNGGEDYIKYHMKAWKLKRLDAVNLTMRSRCYAGFAIRDSQGEKSHVLILESIDPGTFAKSGFNGRMQPLLEGIEKNIERFRDLEPDPSFAQQEGF